MNFFDELKTAFDEQIAKEFNSAQIYRFMSTKLENLGFVGMAKFFWKQADEEEQHAKRFIKFLVENGETPVFLSIDAVDPSIVNNIKSFFALALQHEKEITESIHNLYKLSVENNFYTALPFLQTFINEQIEEENLFQTLFDRITLAGSDISAILIIDKEMGEMD